MKNGKVDVMGINIDISQVLGQKIVDNYLAQITEEDMKTIFDYISSDLWTKTWDEKLIVKERKQDQWGYYKDKEMTIGERIRNHFNDKISEELKKKCDEIIATTDYQEKIEEIANEIIEYATNGYKADMKTRIKERLVNNVVEGTPGYCGISLTSIINQEINKRIHY